MPEYKKTAGKKSKKPNKTGNTVRLLFFWLIIVAIGGVLFLNLSGTGSVAEEQKDLTEILSYANDEKLETITIRGNELHITPRAETNLPSMVSRKEAASSLSEQGFADAIEQGKVNIKVEENIDVLGTIIDVAMIVVPIILVIAFLSYMMRQAQNMNNQSMGFGKAKARLYGNEKKRVTFADVAGNESAKQDLSEIVDFLKAPKKYEKLGARIPSGVLLAGDPGTGKTLMARAVAGEAGVHMLQFVNLPAAAEAVSEQGWKGTLRATTLQEEFFALQGDQFVKTTGNIAANKAYYIGDVDVDAMPVSLEDGTETGIDELEGENGSVKTEVYDLSGRRVTHPKKGHIYIVNDKKRVY